MVDGVERSISGLTESTTCAQIIYALAHATGQKGRFVLVEKYRDAERSLAPTERPLEMLEKWDEHSRYVTFVLKHLDTPVTSGTGGGSMSINTNSALPSHYACSRDFQSEEEIPTSASFLPERSSSPIAKAVPHQFIVGSEQYSMYNPPSSIMPLFRLPAASSSTPVRCAASLLTKQPCCSDTKVYGQQSLSSASLPGFYSASLRQRPPPPAYHEVIEQRYNSLTRGSSVTVPRSRTTRQPNTEGQYDSADPPSEQRTVHAQNSTEATGGVLYNVTLSRSDLERLIENQRRIIDQQKTYLAQLDVSIDDDEQRELIQLERQQTNLRMVLDPLRASDWPGSLQTERTALQKIRDAIADLQRKMEGNAIKLSEQSELEAKLTEQIAAVEQELAELEGSSTEEKNAQLHELLIS